MAERYAKHGLRVAFLVLVVLGAASPYRGWAEAADGDEKAGPLLRVEGAVEHSLSLSRKDLVSLPKQVVRGTDHGGVTAEFEGVTLYEVLKKAGAPVGERLRGKAAASYVVVGASDGYRAVFSLAELDPSFTDDVVLLAYHRDGQPLSDTEGPLRIIVPNEKRHVRWIRMVESLTVRQALPDEKPSR